MVVNVGGTSYTTSVATLKAVESSYFSLMLNGLWEPISTPEGHMFVDRNGAVRRMTSAAGNWKMRSCWAFV